MSNPNTAQTAPSTTPNKSKIFITGASGYIGRTLLSQAIPLGYTVTALSRTPASDETLLSLGATPIRGSLTSLPILTSEASKADIVISIADSAADNYASTSKELRFKTNNDAIDALAQGLKGSWKPLVITSGTLVVPPNENGEETDESAPFWPANSLYATDFETRSLAYKDDGIRTVAIRLAPYVYGRGGSGVSLFMKNFAAAGSGFYVDEGSARTSAVHVDDAARLYLLLAEKGKAGQAYNATAQTDVTQKQLAEAIGRILDIPITSMGFDEAVAKVGTFFAEFLRVANRASSRKAREELGWEIKAEKGILEDVEFGSYVELAEDMRKKE